MTRPAFVLGVDISTTRLDMAAVPCLPYVTIEPEVVRLDIPASRVRDDAARCVRLGRRLRHALESAPYVVAVAIENPIGPHRNTDRALLPILGALTMAADPAAVCWYQAQEWRRILGAVGKAGVSKAGGHDLVCAIVGEACAAMDEHALDALGVALAHRHVIDAHDRREA